MKHKELIIVGLIIVAIGLGTLYNYVTRETFFVGNKASFGAVDNSIYYDDGIDTEDVDVVGRILAQFDLFTEDERFIVKLEKDEKEYRIYLPMLVDYWDDEPFLESIRRLEDRMETRLDQRVRTFLVDGGNTDKRMEIQR